MEEVTIFPEGSFPLISIKLSVAPHSVPSVFLMILPPVSPRSCPSGAQLMVDILHANLHDKSVCKALVAY